jgi:hypothetical protein
LKLDWKNREIHALIEKKSQVSRSPWCLILPSHGLVVDYPRSGGMRMAFDLTVLFEWQDA